MRKAFWFVTALIAVISAPVQGAILIDPARVEIPITRHVDYIEDAGGALTLDNVENFPDSRWTRSGRANLGFGFTRSAIWLRFTLKNPAEKALHYYLEEAWPLIDEIDLFLPDGSGGYRRISTGDYQRFASRPFDHRTFVFPLTLEAGSSITCYMRFRTTSSMILPLTLWQPDSFMHRILREDRVLMLLYGMMLVMIIYNLLMYAAIRQRSYLYYVLFIASFMCFIMTQHGTAFQYLWPEYPWFANDCIPLTLAMVVFFAYLFTRNFLSIGMKFSDIRILYRCFFVISVLGMAISAFALNQDTYVVAMAGTPILAFLSIAGAIYAAIKLSLKRIRAAYFYLSGWIGFFAGGCLYIGKTFSFLPANAMTNWSIMIGILFMMVVLSIAQADMMDSMRRDLAELSSDLEVKVRKRTEELESAMRELESAQMIAERDIKMASNLQMSLLPRNLKDFDDWDLAGVFLPMKGVSGDFYDLYHNGRDLHGIALFDVSGHGIASGLLTILAKSILYRNFNQMPDHNLNSVMKKFNEELLAEIRDIDNYLTGVLLRFNDNTVEYVNAAHTNLMMLDAKTGRVRREKSENRSAHSYPLGIDGIDNSFDVLRFEMKPGDMLLLHSDGIIECRNGGREQFGEERLVKAFGSAPRNSAQAALDYIMDTVAAFTGEVSFHDDVTLIILMKGLGNLTICN